MSDRNTRALARELARLQRRLDRFETHSQGWARSVEESSLDFYDENDLLRLSIGKQADGSYSVRSPEGEVPPAPTEPDVMNLGDGLVVVTWDGRFEERYSGDFRNVRVHIDSDGGAGFVPSRDNQVGVIDARRGGSIVAVTESDVDNAVYVKLVATNNAGQVGPESDATLFDYSDEDGIGDDDEELVWEADDIHVLTAADITAGVATVPLSHEPEVESVVAWWRTVAQEPTEYTVNYGAQTITWPLAGFEAEGDRIWVHYAYQDVDPPDVIVPFGAAGWSYKEVAAGDGTDYSTSDTSSWSTGQAAFGNSTGGAVPDWVTNWAADKRLWLRRDFPAATDVEITVPVEDTCVVYINGSVAGSTPAAGPGVTNVSPATVIEVDAGLLNPGGNNVLAIRADNDNTGSTDPTYLDVQVRGRLT